MEDSFWQGLANACGGTVFVCETPERIFKAEGVHPSARVKCGCGAKRGQPHTVGCLKMRGES